LPTRASRWQLKNYVDSSLIFGTPMLGFGLQFSLVRDIPFATAYSALALGLLYITLAVALRKRQQYALLSDAYLRWRWCSARWRSRSRSTAAGPPLRGPWKVQALSGWDCASSASWHGRSACWCRPARGFLLRRHRRPLLRQRLLSVFERPLLGALLIIAAALFSSWALKQQRPERGSLPYAAYRDAGVVGAAVVWRGRIRPRLVAASQEPAWTGCAYAVLLALTAVASVIGAQRLNWPGLRWFASMVWIALVLITPLLIALYVEPLPGTPIWLAYAALWLGGEWLLRGRPKAGGSAAWCCASCT
jgi:hypothetical protein